MFKKLLLFSSIVLLSSCQPELTTDFSFLEGTWKMEIDDSTYIQETWEKIDDKHYSALNYEVSPSGMKLSEEIEIEITDSGTFYKPTIEVLDGGRQFSYRFVSQENEKYLFENDSLDYPQKIWYQVINENIMEAGIENKSGDKKASFVFLKENKNL